MRVSLPERLKTETRALHTVAERSTFMQMLLSGRLDRLAYCALLRNLHAVYAALEPALARHASLPAIAPVFLPALWRAGALQHDLDALHGPGWAKAIALQPQQRRMSTGCAIWTNPDRRCCWRTPTCVTWVT